MSFIAKIFVLTGLCLLGTHGLQAQEEELRIRGFGFEDGLSHRNVFKIQQDTTGFLWIATEKGLNRFDGHQFLPWTTSDSNFRLPAEFINDMVLADDDRLWLASGQNILIFDHAANRTDSTKPAGNSQMRGKDIRYGSLIANGNGGICAIAFSLKDSSSILQRADRNGTLTDMMRLPGKYEGRPLARLGDLLYVGAYENEIWALREDGSMAARYELPAPQKNKAFSRAVRFQSTDDGTLWALLDNGQVFFLPKGAASFTRHPITDFGLGQIRSTAFYVNGRQDIWLAGVAYRTATGNQPCSSIQQGPTLLHYDTDYKQTRDFSFYLKKALPYSEPPRQIFADRTGVMWIASVFGMIQMTEHRLFEKYMTDGYDCCRDGVCSMRGIAEDERGNIYFAYYSSIHVLNPRTGSLTPLFSPKPLEISIPFGLLAHKGALWTGDGLRIDLRTLQVDTLHCAFNHAEGAVMLDREGDLWFGSKRSICILNPETGATTVIGEKSSGLDEIAFEQITYLHQGKTEGLVWVGTRENGFFSIKKQGGMVKHFNTKKLHGLAHDRILALLESGGYLWAATADGLCRMNMAEEKVKCYTKADGLPNNFINGLLPEGDSAIWASTDNGLSRLDVRTGRFTNYYASDGLTKNEFNRISFHLARDGRMYFGGINGVNAFYPGPRYSHRQDVANSRLLFTEFSKFDGERDVRHKCGLREGQQIELSYRDEMFSFQFALADFTDPRKHLYSYILEGWDKEWSQESPTNFARYFNIPAGTYLFRVRAAKSAGEWVEDELMVPLVVRQAFYKSAWFNILVLGLFSLLVFGIMRYRLYLARKHEHELEVQVQERTRELETEKHKSEELLLNILPAETADELKQFGAAKARRYENVTVLFSDFIGFSNMASEMSPEELVAEIDHCFRAFDEITDLHGLEKIKTVGDAYLLAGGLNGEENKQDAAVRAVRAGLDFQKFLDKLAMERAASGRSCFKARVGIHTGQVVAGIVGIKKFAYDIWGDTVNIAERLQSGGEACKVNVSKSTHELVKDHFTCIYRGKIKAKHDKEVDMYFVEG